MSETTQAPQQVADSILYNGLIWTGDTSCPEVSAVALKGNMVLAVGNSSDILGIYQGASTECYDLQGKRVIPGLSDSHMHLLNVGKAMESVDLGGSRSAQDIVERLLAGHGAQQGGGVIQGRGFNHEQFDDRRMPDRHDLDRVSTTRPVVAVRTCGHIAVVNTKALELMGIATAGQLANTGVGSDEIRVEADGSASGVLTERALSLMSRLPSTKPSHEDLQRMIVNASQAMIASGLTTVHTDDFGGDPEQWEDIAAAYHAVSTEGKLPLRIAHQLRFDSPDAVQSFVVWQKSTAERLGFAPRALHYSSVKLMTDGSLGGRTAAMSEPYADDATTCGVPVLSREQMTAILTKAHAAGFILSGHAIGDQAITDLVEAMGAAVPKDKWADARSQVIHAQITTKAMLERMRELHIHCDIQPAFVATDYPIVAERVGEAKASTSYAWKAMLDLGITISGGSDSPVEPFNPFYGIYCAVTRTDVAGLPQGGWLPEQKLSVAEAVHAYTVGSAYAERREDCKGRIWPGQLADILLIDQDIFVIDQQHIKDTQVLVSWIDGRIVYTNQSFCLAQSLEC